MSRATCLFTGLITLLALSGCRSSIFNPDLGSHFRLPRWAGGSDQVPNPPESLDREETGVASLDSRNSGPPIAGASSGKTTSATATPANSAGISQRLSAARAAYETGRFTTATSHLAGIIAEQPDHAPAHHLMAIILSRQNDHAASDRHFESAIAAEPKNANLLSDYAFSKTRRFDLAAAETLLKKALAIDPNNAFALNNLGTVQAKQGRYDDALATLRRAGPEQEAQAKLARLFPDGRPALEDTPGRSPDSLALPEARDATTPAADSVSALPPRSLEPPGQSDTLLPARRLDGSAVPDTPTTDPIPAHRTNTTAASPATTARVIPSEPLIPSPSTRPIDTDLPSRPLPWSSSAGSAEKPAGPIRPAGSITTNRRVSPATARSAARLGLAIGPGAIVPHNDPGSSSTPSRAMSPPETITPDARTRPLIPDSTGTRQPGALPGTGSITVSDPLSEFERQMREEPADREAVRRELIPESGSGLAPGTDN